MAGTAENGLPTSFFFLWLLCAHFIAAALKALTRHNSALSAAKSCNTDGLEKVEMELGEMRGGEVKFVRGECVCVKIQSVLYICFTTKYLCYESLLQAEPITVNETIRETWRVKGGIQIKVLLASHFLSICIIMDRTPSSHVCVYGPGSVCVCVCTSNQISEVTAHTSAYTQKQGGLITKSLCT